MFGTSHPPAQRTHNKASKSQPAGGHQRTWPHSRTCTDATAETKGCPTSSYQTSTEQQDGQESHSHPATHLNNRSGSYRIPAACQPHTAPLPARKHTPDATTHQQPNTRIEMRATAVQRDRKKAQEHATPARPRGNPPRTPITHRCTLIEGPVRRSKTTRQAI
jgi:hypothetical protein